MKSGNFNFLEPSGLFQACNGTALPLPSGGRSCCFVHLYETIGRISIKFGIGILRRGRSIITPKLVYFYTAAFLHNADRRRISSLNTDKTFNNIMTVSRNRREIMFKIIK